MQVDPRVTFWLGIIVTVTIGIGTGAVHLAHAVPDAWIPAVVAWNNIFSFVGSAVLTALVGVSSKASGPLVKP